MVKRKGKFGEFWGCSAYGRTKCKGKPGDRKRVPAVAFPLQLMEWVAPDEPVALKMVDRERWARAEERKEWLKIKRRAF